MAIRLYPDIVVATAINFARKFNVENRNKKRFNTIRLDINRCLSLQDAYTHIGIVNVQLGFEFKKWNKEDYERYISMFSKGFNKVGPGEYDIDLIELLDIRNKISLDPLDENYSETLESYLDNIPYHEFVYMLCDTLFILSSYPVDVMNKLGLNCEKESYSRVLK